MSLVPVLFKHILAILEPRHRRALMGLCALTVCIGLVEMGVAGGISLLGVTMSAPESLAKLPGYWLLLATAEQLPNSVSFMLRMLVVVMSLVCACIAVKNILLAFLTWQQNRISNDISWDYMLQLYAAYLRAPFIWHTMQNSAELQLYLAWKYYVSLFIFNMVQAISQAVVIVILLVAAVTVAGLAAILTFTSVGILGFGIYHFFRSRAQDLGQQVSELEEQLSRSTLGCLHGMREVRIYGTELQFYAETAALHEPYVRIASVRDLMGSVPQWILESLGIVLLLGVLSGMVWSGASEAKTVGILTLLAAVCWRMLPAANKFLGSLLCLQSFLPYVRTVIDKLHEVPPIQVAKGKNVVPFKQTIEMEDVSFRYPEAKRKTLSEVSVCIRKGAMVGFVGISGSGKSTLVNILAGLFTAESGRLSVDGVDLKQEQALRIGYVPQNIYLLDASLAENIAFSSWGQSIDRDRVHECCRLAALDFVESLPGGIDNPLGERGVRLSGGQVQRVGIARALYNRPDILIFDEATSSLDGATETAIQQTLVDLRSTVTMVIVAHRLTTVESCDYVYWIDEGKVRMEGAAQNVLPSYQAFLQSAKNVENEFTA